MNRDQIIQQDAEFTEKIEAIRDCTHKRTITASDDGIYRIVCTDCNRSWDEGEEII